MTHLATKTFRTEAAAREFLATITGATHSGVTTVTEPTRKGWRTVFVARAFR